MKVWRSFGSWASAHLIIETLGTLPEPAQKAVDALKPGQFTEPVTLLEGIAVFRLAQRKPPVLNPLEAVRERARELYLRDRADEAWSSLLAKLRRDTPVQMDETRFLPAR